MTKRPLPCGHMVDDATAVDGPGPSASEGGTAPRPGAVSVCFYCGALGIFTGNGLEVRPVTDDERVELLAHKEVATAVAAVLAYRASDDEGGGHARNR